MLFRCFVSQCLTTCHVMTHFVFLKTGTQSHVAMEVRCPSLSLTQLICAIPPLSRCNLIKSSYMPVIHVCVYNQLLRSAVWRRHIVACRVTSQIVRGSNPSRDKRSSLLRSRPYRLLFIAYRGFVPGVKRFGCGVDRSLPSSVHVKNEWIYTVWFFRYQTQENVNISKTIHQILNMHI